MSTDELRARTAELEARLRQLQLILACVVIAFVGFIGLQASGWLPIRGSSLYIGGGDDPVLTVTRLLDGSILTLSGDSGEASASLLAGSAASILILRSREGGQAQLFSSGESAFANLSSEGKGAVRLSAAGMRPMASLSHGGDGRRLFLGLGFESEIGVLDGDLSAQRAPIMPQTHSVTDTTSLDRTPPPSRSTSDPE